MDSMAKMDIDDSRFCYDCKRDCIYLKLEIIYKSRDLENAKDFNISDEYFGVANYYMQRVIVSKKFFDIYEIQNERH
ncbi:MAG: hypothetical protein K0S61_4907 [Anaerocolumna sp.]|jgi:hypothetical protein|nr:hypothetical protein [Anaerocolumna sp.]